jgi:hypothetical protein
LVPNLQLLFVQKKGKFLQQIILVIIFQLLKLGKSVFKLLYFFIFLSESLLLGRELFRGSVLGSDREATPFEQIDLL